MSPQWSATKARKVLSALKRAGWVELRKRGSHITLERNGDLYTWSFADGEELGAPMLKRISKHTGLRPEDL